MKIALIVGSLSTGSINRNFATELEKLLPSDVSFENVDIDFPLFSEDKESNVSEVVKKAKSTIVDADGVLIITPEYNRGVTGVLKNAIDWISRPYGQNSFDRKQVVLAGVSGGSLGTAPAQQHLKAIMLYLNANVLGQPEMYLQNSKVFNSDGSIKEESKDLILSFVDAMIEHISTHK